MTSDRLHMRKTETTIQSQHNKHTVQINRHNKTRIKNNIRNYNNAVTINVNKHPKVT